MKRSAIFAATGVLMGVIGLAGAEEPTMTTGDQAIGSVVSLAEEAQTEPEAFSKGSWALQLSGSYIDSDGVSNDEAEGGSANVGLGYYLLDRIGIYGEVAGYGVEEDRFEPTDATGAGFNLLLRWHFLQVDRLSLYVDGGAGIVGFDTEFPSGGTEFNFTERVGLGASYRLGENLHLLGGARYMHLSNAAIEGRDRNPGLDALEYYVGLMFTF